MWIKKAWLPLLLLGTIFNCHSQARRIRVERPIASEEAEESIQYYAAEPQDDVDQRQRVVLVSSADQYNGLYGQPAASSRSAQTDNYIPRVPVKAREQSSRSSSRKEDANNRPPPVQTIRNYSKVNDDGSFTFGYEAADGSFKEETRGTDCVVRGKYGYIDPDGNKREFTYVSGNPCDPNAPKDEEEDELPEDESNENVPQNYPVRPVRPILRQPVSTPKPVTLFQQTYEQSEEEQPEPEQLLRPTPTPAVRQPTYSARPQYYQQTSAAQSDQVYQRPRLQPTTPSSVYRQSIAPVSITPRPVQPTQAARTQLPATTYRPQLVQVAVTPRPSSLYTPKPGPTFAPSKQLDFDAEFQKFQQDNVISQTPKSNRPDNQIYSSALVYDPATGQYKNQLYQTLSQTDGDFSFAQNIQPYVAQQSYQRPTALQQIAAPQRFAPQPQRTASQYATPRPLLNNQAAYQAQQAEQLFQNSAQLYAQQQKVREQQQQQSQRAPTQTQAPVYYIQPSIDQTGALGASQIDAFLRGHNIQF